MGDQHDGRAVLATGRSLFVLPEDEPRTRRTTDLLLVASACVGLLLIATIAEPQAGYERTVHSFFTALPGFLAGIWQALLGVLSLFTVVLIAVAIVRRRGALARDLIVAGLLALAAAAVLARAVEGSWPAVWDSLTALGPPAEFPSIRLGVSGAVLLAALPHVGRPLRLLAGWILGLGTVSALALSTTTPSGAISALLIALISAGAVHAVFGAPVGTPTRTDLAAALAALDVRVVTIDDGRLGPDGSYEVDATEADGHRVVAKVYGRDAHDTQLAVSVWRRFWYRGQGNAVTFGRLRQVQHEALLTLLAGQAGVQVPQVVRAGVTPEGDALLVLRPLGVPLASRATDGAGPDSAASDTDVRVLVRQIWTTVRGLHRAGIVHGQLDAEHLTVDGAEVGLTDFRNASIAETAGQRNQDVAQAFVATALLVGAEDAVELAADALGADDLAADDLAAALPYLQPAALTAPQRAAIKRGDLDLPDARARAAARAGVEVPQLQRIQRITWMTIAQVVLLPVAMLALVSGITSLDVDQLRDQLADARWGLVVLAAVIVQLSWVTQTLSALGASPIALPARAVYVLQLAISYVNLAVPSSAGRIALNVRFLQRRGLPSGSALAAGALDGFAGFVVEMLLLLTILLFSPDSRTFDVELGSIDIPTKLLLLVVGAVLACVAVVVAVPRFRRSVWAWVRTMTVEAIDALRGLRSPRRLGLLLGGNLLTNVVQGLTLGAILAGFGQPLGLGQLILILVGTSLLSGVMPVPGGIGVVEGALVFGMVGAGLNEEVAFAAAIVYRLMTFYLPPIWGFFALRWLEREDYI